MPAGAVFSDSVHTRRVGISVSDALVAALRINGAFPPPLGLLVCVIVGQTAPVARTFDPPRVLVTLRHAGGFLSIDGAYKVPPSESLSPLGPGLYQVEIRGEFYRPFPFALTWPVPLNDPRVPVSASGTADLMPSPAYPLPDVSTSRFQLGPTIIRGCLFTQDGTPQGGVGVEALNLPLLNPPELPSIGVWPFFKTATDVNGDWAVVLPGRRYIDATPETLPLPSPTLQKNVTIRFALTGGNQDVTIPVTLASDNSLRNTALRGQVRGAGGRPIAGAVITTSLNARQSRSRADGGWSLHFDFAQSTTPGVSVTATLPGGQTAIVAGVEVRRQATIVVPTIQFP